MGYRAPVLTDRREAILLHIHAKPGVTATLLAREMNEERSTIDYHVRRLIRGGFVCERRDGKHLRYFVPGATPTREHDPRFRDIERVAASLAEQPQAHRVSELAARLGIARTRVRCALTRLEKEQRAAHIAYAYWGPKGEGTA